MKNNIIISVILIILSMAVACSNENVLDEENSLGDKLNSTNTKAVTFSGAAAMDNVSVLIFGYNGSDYKYQRSISSGWSPEGKVSTSLEIGTYKFLFLKYKEINTIFNPNPLNTSSVFDAIRIDAKTNPNKQGYLLPVDEIWLPETKNMANATYSIIEPVTISNTLVRAVSQVQLNLKRAYKNGTTMIPYPYTVNNIMENIKEITMDIDGVGESIDIAGGIGFSKTIYSAQSESQITNDGFAIFDGPLVFPNGSGLNTSVKITIIPQDNSLFPEMTASVEGMLERNRKLEITLWLTSTYKLIDVTVDTEPISKEEDGDIGIWE